MLRVTMSTSGNVRSCRGLLMTRPFFAYIIFFSLMFQRSHGELRLGQAVNANSSFPLLAKLCHSFNYSRDQYPRNRVEISHCVKEGDGRSQDAGQLLHVPFLRTWRRTSGQSFLGCPKEAVHLTRGICLKPCASFIDISKVAQMFRRFLNMEESGNNSGEDLGSHAMKFEGRAARLWKEWVLSLPPISRWYFLLCGLTSASTMTLAAVGHPLPPSFFQFIPSRVLAGGEMWRIVTPLFYLGDSPISAALSLAFAYTYLPLIERHYSSDNTVGRHEADHPKVSKDRSRFLKALLWGAGCSYGLVGMRLLPPSQQQQFFFSFFLFMFSRIDPTGEAELLWNINCSNAALPLLLVLQHLLLDGQLLKADIWGALAALGYLIMKPNL